MPIIIRICLQSCKQKREGMGRMQKKKYISAPVPTFWSLQLWSQIEWNKGMPGKQMHEKLALSWCTEIKKG